MQKVPLCKECKWYTPIAGEIKNGFCHKGEIREKIVKPYDGQPKKCKMENIAEDQGGEE